MWAHLSLKTVCIKKCKWGSYFGEIHRLPKVCNKYVICCHRTIVGCFAVKVEMDGTGPIKLE